MKNKASRDQKKIRVLLLEKNTDIRARAFNLLAQEPLIEIVGEAGNLRQVTTLLKQTRPDILLLNLSIGWIENPDTFRKIRTRFPDLRVMAMSFADEGSYFFRIPGEGSTGYLVKAVSLSEFIADIKRPRKAEGKSRAGLLDYTTPVQLRPPGKPVYKLTPREKQILKLLAEGKSNQEIAKALTLRSSTVRTHRSNLMLKLGLPGSVELIKMAISRGLPPLT